MKKIFAGVFLGIFSCLCANGQQQTLSVGTESTNTKAVLWLHSPTANQGLIVPLVSTTSAVNAGSQEQGMIVFDLGQNKLVYFDGTAWVAIQPTTDANQQDISIDGNDITITGGSSVKIADAVPATTGQLLQWDGAKWTTTSASAPQVGQVLKWDGSSWNASADNELSTTLTNGQLLLGNASDIASPVTMTGDATISGTGTITIGNGAVNSDKILDGSIGNADLATMSAANGQVLKFNGTNWVPSADNGTTTALNNAQILVGNASNIATPVNVSGDATISNTGALTIANDAVNSAKILDGAIAEADLANGSVTSAKILNSTIVAEDLASMGATNGQVLTFDGTTWVPSASPGWLLTGNNATVDGTHFIGTTDDVPLNFKVNNEKAGRLESSAATANSFYGYQAGNVNAGTFNTGLGHRALLENTTGDANTAVGPGSLEHNKIGFDNSAIGYKALGSNSGGHRNTAVGRDALAMVNTNDNTSIGAYSLAVSTTGSNNVAVGSYTLTSNTIGGGNSAFGNYSLMDNTTGNNNVAVGRDAANNNTTGISNVALGVNAAFTNTTGNNNVAVGSNALFQNATGISNTAIGAFTFTTGAGVYSNSTAIGFNAQVTASDMIRLGNASITNISAQVDITVTSDRRFKTAIQENVSGLSFIMKLRPVTYHFDMSKLNRFIGTPDSLRSFDAENKQEKVLHSGFIAQEVEEAALSLGYDFSGIHKPESESDYYGLRYEEFTVPLVKAMQEQQNMIEQLQQKNQALEQEIAEIRNALGMEAKIKAQTKD